MTYTINIEVNYTTGYVGIDWCPLDPFPVGGHAQIFRPDGTLLGEDTLANTSCKANYTWDYFKACGLWKAQISDSNWNILGYKTFYIDVVQWKQGLTCGGGMTYNITMIAGIGGQIQAFQNGIDLGYFRGSKTITVNSGDNISVWCDADTGYTFTKLCTPDGTCTSLRPFNFTANMNISMTATFTPIGGTTSPPPTITPPPTTIPPPAQWTCNPITCPNDGKHYCISGTCIPQTYIYIGIVGLFALMMFKK